MSRYLNPLTITVAALLVVGGLCLGFAIHRIGLDALVFLGTLTLALAVIAGIFVRRMTHPDVSVEQMLYTTDHPTRT